MHERTGFGLTHSLLPPVSACAAALSKIGSSPTVMEGVKRFQIFDFGMRIEILICVDPLNPCSSVAKCL